MLEDELFDTKGVTMENNPGLDKEKNQWLRTLWSFGSNASDDVYACFNFTDPSVMYGELLEDLA